MRHKTQDHENKNLFANYVSTQLNQTKNYQSHNNKLFLEYDLYRKNIKPHLPKSKDSCILDIGFGRGEFLRYLKTEGFTSIWGVELSTEAVALAKSYGLVNIIHTASTEKYLEKNINRYDTIVMLDTLEHIQKNKVIGLLRRIRTALKTGGCFIAKVPNGSNPLNSNIWWCDFTHEFIYTAHSLKQVCLIAGFTDVKIYPVKEGG